MPRLNTCPHPRHVTLTTVYPLVLRSLSPSVVGHAPLLATAGNLSPECVLNMGCVICAFTIVVNLL